MPHLCSCFPWPRSSVHPESKTAGDSFSECVTELESLLSAADRRTVRMVYNYVACTDAMPQEGGKVNASKCIEREAFQDYLGLPASVFNHLWSAFVSHKNHFHDQSPTNTLDYHAFLHSVVSFALVDEPELNLFQLMDAFSHGAGERLRTSPRGSRRGSTGASAEISRAASSSDPDVAMQTVATSGGAPLLDQLRVRKVVHPAKKTTRSKKRHSSTVDGVVVLTEKLVAVQPGDEFATVTFADLCDIVEAVACLRMHKLAAINHAHGKLPTAPGQESTSSSIHLFDLDLDHNSSEHIESLVTQIFRYTGHGHVAPNGLLPTFKSTETLQLTKLRAWVSSQCPNLPGILASFLRDHCATAYKIPKEAVVALESQEGKFDPSKSSTAVARVNVRMTPDAVLPVIHSDEATPKILTPSVCWLLSSFVPASAAKKAAKFKSSPVQAVWTLLYSGNHHGFSLQMFRDHVFRCAGPTVVLVRGRCKAGSGKPEVGKEDQDVITVGAYVATVWHEGRNAYFGNEECFCFEVGPCFEVLRPTMQSTSYVEFTPDGISFGGTSQESRILLDSTLQSGCYQQHPVGLSSAPTYGYSRTRGAAVGFKGGSYRDFAVEFEVTDVEVYGVGGMEVNGERGPGGGKVGGSKFAAEVGGDGGEGNGEGSDDAESQIKDADYLKFLESLKPPVA